jgi:hypothetical protein
MCSRPGCRGKHLTLRQIERRLGENLMLRSLKFLLVKKGLKDNQFTEAA